MLKYRILVLYTLGESEREEFLTKIQKKYPNTQTLQDQSSLAIMDTNYKEVLQYLTDICKKFDKEEKGHFVNLYYPIGILDPHDKNTDYIYGKVVWKSNN